MLAVLIIDSAEHKILQSMAETGRAPVLKGLMDRGLTLPLRSDAHLLDGSVFQTLLTGANPAVHGMYKYRQLVPGTYGYAFSKARDTPIPQIWAVLSDRGKRSCVFDVPKAFAFPEFNGSLVSSWSAYSAAADSDSVPPQLFQNLIRRFGPHPQRHQVPIPLPAANYTEIRDHLVAAAMTRADICSWMLSQENFDFFITTFSESHVAGHQFWHLRDSTHPLYNAQAADICADGLETVYAGIDAAIGRIGEALPSDATLIVMTQQGLMNNFTGSPYLPEWLSRRSGKNKKSISSRLSVRLASTFGSPLRAAIGRSLPEAITDRWISRKYRCDGDVFMLAGSEFMSFLRLNVHGREPRGTIPRGDYADQLNALRNDLLQLENPHTGGPAVELVVFPRDLYSGPQVEALPDVVVCWRDDEPLHGLRCPTHGVITDGIEFTDLTHSCHSGDGLAVLSGPKIAQGTHDWVVTMPEMTATWYDMLGEVIPDHVEGQPIHF